MKYFREKEWDLKGIQHDFLFWKSSIFSTIAILSFRRVLHIRILPPGKALC